MAQYEHLPIYKKAMDIAVYLENLVRGFSRYHKYTLGLELRQLSYRILCLITQANAERHRHATLVALCDSIEALKVTLRLCSESVADTGALPRVSRGNALDLRAHASLGVPKIIGCLHAQPQPRPVAAELPEPHGHFR